jgi:hypothetical protein
MLDVPEKAAHSAMNRRRGPLIRLWMLLVFVVVIAVPIAWCVQRARFQQLVAKRVLGLQGFVAYAHELDAGGEYVQPRPAPPGPDWLRGFVGDDYFRSIRAVSFYPPRPGEGYRVEEKRERDREVLPLVARLPEPMRVTITDATDDSLASLAGDRNLMALTLSGGDMTDAGVNALGDLPVIELLNIQRGTYVTDAACERIARWPRLDFVIVNECDVGDRGIEHLSRCYSLTRLVVMRSDGRRTITDAALVAISTMRDMTFLVLSGTEISDGGLASLAGLAHLEYLEIESDRLTDDALVSVQGFKRLRSVSLQSPLITSDGRQRLRDTRPGLTVN